MTPTNQTAGPDPTFGERMAACVADIHADQQRAVADSRMRYEQEKREAVERYVMELRVEVLRAVLARANRIPYVVTGLYADDAPEERRIPDAVMHGGDAWAHFARRALAIHERANEMNNEGALDDPYDPKHWDQIRLQRAGTHAAAVELLAEGFVLAFACDQYASAKHVWRSSEATDGRG